MSQPSRRKSAHSASQQLALCGMMAALSVALLLTSGLIPIMTYAAPLLCGLLLIPLRLAYGRRQAWLTWLAVALLVLLMGVDKEAAFFYLFFGWYPIAKWDVERRVQKKGLQLLLKALLFAVLVCAMYALLAFVLHMDALVQEFGDMGRLMTALFLLALVGCLLLFDRVITPLTVLYVQRIQPRIKWLR